MSRKSTKPTKNNTHKTKSRHKQCVFCLSDEVDDLNLGQFKTYKNIKVHYFCMLLSSGLSQNGKDNEGILGFLPKDINAEIRRGQRLKCYYCKRNGATIGCANNRCTKAFHLPCSVKRNSLHQFYGAFPSFCENHKPEQAVSLKDIETFKLSKNNVCPICLFTIDEICKHKTVRTPCCKNAWFHRSCVQEQALHAGYFFKCPLCCNKDNFQQEMLKYGIYIPEQDASWELEDNAFQDLLYRHNTCDVLECLCPDGREHNADGSQWEIILCNSCGSQGCHVKCGSLGWINRAWECQNCSNVRKPSQSKQKSNNLMSSHYKRKQLVNSCILLKKPRLDEKKQNSHVNISSDEDTDVDIINIDIKPSSPLRYSNNGQTSRPAPRKLEPELVCITDSDDSSDDETSYNNRNKRSQVFKGYKLSPSSSSSRNDLKKLIANSTKNNNNEKLFSKPIRVFDTFQPSPQIEEMKATDNKIFISNSSKNHNGYVNLNSISDDDNRSEVHSEVDPGFYHNFDSDDDEEKKEGRNLASSLVKSQRSEVPATEIWVPETDCRYEFYARTGASGVKIVVLTTEVSSDGE